MKLYTSIDDLSQTFSDFKNPVPETVRSNIDTLIHTVVFSNDEKVTHEAAAIIKKTADASGINVTSIYPFYKALGNGVIPHTFTVPAINIRALTYDTAILLFSLMKKHNIGPLVFEIAKSEMVYTKQRPFEYATVILSAAIKTGYTGPVFIQGDHYQVNLNRFTEDKADEIATLENLIRESLDAGFYNIDIDASTLVDLTQSTLADQQKNNSEVTAHLTKVIRKTQPADHHISIGGEIGHIGGINSTVDDFRAFMNLYIQNISGNDGISKVSVQTGSSHGGIPLADGTVQKAAIDFSVLASIGKAAREEYQMAGAVQHGASTLPIEFFSEFPKNNTAEIHLATGFQNTVFETLPKDLKNQMYEWVKKEKRDEWKKDYNEEQFLYKSRKHALGIFKKELWDLRAEEKQPILDALTKQFESIFDKLSIYNTREVLEDSMH